MASTGSADLTSPKSQNMAATASLIALSPPDVLTFNLARNSSPKVTLRVTNTSNAKIAFKIKTTQPTWYYVRPNQQIVDVDKTEEVTIVLVDSECNRYLDQIADDQADKQLDKHRFLVQTKVIDDLTFNKISSLPQNARADEYTKLWDGGKDDKKNQKLRVEFTLPKSSEDGTGGTDSARSTNTPLNSVSESMDSVRRRLPKPDSTSSSKISENATPETIFGELQNLRKKYDAVVEYTVHLTAERDFHFSQLEELKRELNKEKSRKKTPETLKSGKTAERTNDRKSGQQGFSLFVVFLLALLAFLAGRYLHS
eukprot:gene13183-27882_t